MINQYIENCVNKTSDRTRYGNENNKFVFTNKFENKFKYSWEPNNQHKMKKVIKGMIKKNVKTVDETKMLPLLYKTVVPKCLTRW